MHIITTGKYAYNNGYFVVDFIENAYFMIVNTFALL